MAYCRNCGSKLADGVKFCSECGYKNEVAEQNIKEEKTNENKRKVLYKGEVHKCPSCGETLKSYAVRCPACGFEINAVESSGRFSDLIDKINQLENSKIGKRKKEIDIINNQIYNTIESYQVPHGKEQLFEFILLARDKKDSNVNSNSGEQVEHYSNLRKIWGKKYNQLYEKAMTLYKNDSDIVLIMEKPEEKKKKLFKKIGIVAGVLTAVIAFGISDYFLIKDEIDTSTPIEDPNMVALGYNTSDLVGKHYTEVVAVFEGKGFTNIQLNAIEDLVTGWLTKDGEVESITINGDNDFAKKDIFPKDAQVVITYHTFPPKD